MGPATGPTNNRTDCDNSSIARRSGENELLELAARYQAAGYSVIVVGADKRPRGPWHEVTTRQLTPAELRQNVRHGGTGLAVIGGAVSGGLTVLDFDPDKSVRAREKLDLESTFVKPWLEAIKTVLDPDMLPCQRTPSGGWQFYIRCPTTVRNTKLAGVPAWKMSDGHVLVGTLGAPHYAIETRGQGGYAVIPTDGSGRSWVNLDLLATPTGTPEQLEVMLEAARTRPGAEIRSAEKQCKAPPPERGGAVRGDALAASRRRICSWSFLGIRIRKAESCHSLLEELLGLSPLPHYRRHILASQLPAALGVSPPAGHLLAGVGWTLTHPKAWNLTALSLMVLTLCLVLGGRRLSPLFPGVLVAVVIGVGLSHLLSYQGPVVGEAPSAFPVPSLALPWAVLPDLLLGGVVIALIGFAEAASIARLYAVQWRLRWDPNREFVSQGVAKLTSGLFGGFPVGGSFSRSSVGVLAGATTRLAGAITGLTVLAFLPLTLSAGPAAQGGAGGGGDRCGAEPRAISEPT